MEKGIGWADLHDATLEAISICWVTGCAFVRLKTGIKTHIDVSIVGFEIVKVVCPRNFPWGMSVSVNEIRETVLDSSLPVYRLEVEMQSGDVITVDALRFEVES